MVRCAFIRVPSRRIVFFPLLALTLHAADPARIVFTKTFPGSNPAFVEVAIDRTGETSYKEAPGDDPDTFKLSPQITGDMFNLADKLDHFTHPIESGLRVANMGAKRFRWESGSEKGEATFNYSTDENAKALQDWFERIGESERLVFILQRATRHDHLGVNDAMLAIQAEWDARRLIMLPSLVALLEQVAGNDALMHIARERAARMVDAIHAQPK
jgi:hypothetical protein